MNSVQQHNHQMNVPLHHTHFREQFVFSYCGFNVPSSALKAFLTMLIDFYNMKLKGLVALKFDNCHLVWRMKLFLRGWKKKKKWNAPNKVGSLPWSTLTLRNSKMNTKLNFHSSLQLHVFFLSFMWAKSLT